MSYFAHRSNEYLFVDYFLEQAIRKLHGMVGNAVTEGRYLVLGVGSTQLYQAALFALADSSQATPTPVVSATPHYSVETTNKQLLPNH
jgi:L-tryptophan--pyruvate aminotransferase